MNRARQGRVEHSAAYIILLREREAFIPYVRCQRSDIRDQISEIRDQMYGVCGWGWRGIVASVLFIYA